MFKADFSRRPVKRIGAGFIAAAIALAACLAPTVAMADDPLVQGNVGWVRVAGNELRVVLTTGVELFSYTSGTPTQGLPGCSTAGGLDVTKGYQALAQSALLSGKHVGVYFLPCGNPSKYIITGFEVAK